MSFFVSERRKKFEENIPPFSLSFFFSGKSSDSPYPFIVNKNFYYLTKIDQENTILLILKTANEIKEIIFTEIIDEKKSLWIGEQLSNKEIEEISGIKNILPISNFDNVVSSIITNQARYGEIDKLYFELNKNDMNGLASIEENYARKLKDSYPFVLVKNYSYIMSNLRVIKDEEEIENITKAIEITEKSISYMISMAKPGMYEYQLESFYLQKLKYNNVNVSFESIIAGGANATILHYSKNDNCIKNNELVLCDVGCFYHNYSSDISRTFPINGKFTNRQKEIYEIVLEANKKAISYLKPGVTILDFNDYGKKILTEGLKRIGIITKDEEIDRYYYHSLGHFLGLDVHDIGSIYEPLKEGMVITVEPGLYIKEENIGIRIEDDILITKDGNINLSKQIPKEIDEIEK